MKNVRFIKEVKPRLRDEVSQSDSEMLALLVDSGLVLSEVQEFELALTQATAIALQIGQCEGATIYEADGQFLYGLSSRNTELETRHQQTPFSSFSLEINQNSIAGYVASAGQALNIENVYDLPTNVPFTFNPSFDNQIGYRSQSMLLVPMLDLRGTILGVLQLINRKVLGQITAFPEKIEPYVKALASQIGMVLRNIRHAHELNRSRVETVKQFIRASEFHDLDTGMHIERMSRYSALLYSKLGYDEQGCEVLRLGSMLHDVGKMCIPDNVLKKPGKLTPDEWEVMKTHTTLGHKMLSDSESPFLQVGALIALTHHEKWDGSGYPNGLKGEDIPLEGRIVALADVFDALCSRRVYKKSWPLEEVLDTIRSSAGSHFDPKLTSIFLENIDEILEIQAQFTPNAEAPARSFLAPASQDSSPKAS